MCTFLFVRLPKLWQKERVCELFRYRFAFTVFQITRHFIHDDLLISSNTLSWQFITILCFDELVANSCEFVQSQGPFKRHSFQLKT